MIEFEWPKMTVSEWVTFETIVNHSTLVRAGGVWWRRPRPLYYRAFDLLTAVPQSVRAPWLGLGFGAVIFPTKNEAVSNARIGVIMDDRASEYDSRRLSTSVQRDLKRGRKTVELRIVDDPEAFGRDAYPVYRCFFGRTGYRHLSNRIERNSFEGWARNLLSVSGVRVIGAFLEGVMCASAVTFRVGSTVFYNSYFANQAALAHMTSDVVLDGIRSVAARSSGVENVFAASVGMPRGLDKFYLRRGFKHVCLPACVRGNPVTLAFMRRFAAKTYSRLVGRMAEAEEPVPTVTDLSGSLGVGCPKDTVPSTRHDCPTRESH